MSEVASFLDDLALKRLTGRRQKSRQIEWLRSEGIPFRISATGHPVVLWAALESKSARFNDRWTPRVLEV
jgi:hypothetical protein